MELDSRFLRGIGSGRWICRADFDQLAEGNGESAAAVAVSQPWVEASIPAIRGGSGVTGPETGKRGRGSTGPVYGR